jgi:hypothetical protein
MIELNDCKSCADRILSKLIDVESRGLRDSLGDKDYPKARRWAKQLAKTLVMFHKEMEARDEGN